MANPFPLCILVRPGFEKTYQSWMLQAPDENVAFGTDVFIVATLDGNRVQAVFYPCTKWAICAWVQFTQGHKCNCNSSERPALGPSPRKGSSISPSNTRLDTVLESGLVQHLHLGKVAVGVFRVHPLVDPGFKKIYQSRWRNGTRAHVAFGAKFLQQRLLTGTVYKLFFAV